MFDGLVNLYDDFTKNERVQSLERLAFEYDFYFSKSEPYGEQTSDIKAFKLFDKKGTKRFLGILGQDLKNKKGEIRFYDYLKTRDLETKTTSVIEIRSDDLDFEAFMIKPIKGLGKMRNIFKRSKHKDLSVFYNNFKIIPSDSQKAINLSEDALLLFSEFPGLTFEADRNYFLFYLKNKEIKLSEIIGNMDFAEEFMEKLADKIDDGFV